jgi:transposase
MTKNTVRQTRREDGRGVDIPAMTRGLRREQEKRRRLRALVAGRPLIVGIDLAREHQAFSFYAGEIVGRRRLDCAAQQICGRIWAEAEKLRQKHGCDRILFALEPAGHYWALAAEAFEDAGVDYVLVHPLAVKREREATRFTPEKHDPRDADLVAELAAVGKILEARLFSCSKRMALNALAREYFLVRRHSAAEKTRLSNFWDRLLPEVFELFREVAGQTALAVGAALLPFSRLAEMSTAEWCARVKEHARGARILTRRAGDLHAVLLAAHQALHRRATDALPFRIAHAAERRRLLEAQKAHLREEILHRYQGCEEAVYLDSIAGSDPFYNALTLALVGDFGLYDDPRAIVKLAGSEVNEYASGDWHGRSRISHRGRALLRAAAYQQGRYLVNNNTDFASRLCHLTNRTDRPRLLEKQARVAIANSYLRTAHVLVTQKTLYRSRAELAKEVTR